MDSSRPGFERCDSYEDQLHNLFLSCRSPEAPPDQDHLDEAGLRILCGQLELGPEQSEALIGDLLGQARGGAGGGDDPKHVAFEAFKEGLVTFLEQRLANNNSHGGAAAAAAAAATPHQTDSPDRAPLAEAEADNEDDDREVAPRVVYRNKKYGRKSRPSSVDLSDADNDEEEAEGNKHKLHKIRDGEDEQIFSSSPPQSHSSSWTSPMRSRPSPPATLMSPQRSPNRVSPNSPQRRLYMTQGSPHRARMVPGLRQSPQSPRSVSDLSFAISSSSGVGRGGAPGNDDREYLSAIWERLGVGSDGFLNQKELGQVCECIGMEKLPEEILSQLFMKLDSDNDGRVSFDELLTLIQSGIREHEHSSSSRAVPRFSPPPMLRQIGSGSKLSSLELSPGSRSGRRSSLFSHTSPLSDSLKTNATVEYSFFSAIDPEATGFATSESILEHLESLGVHQAQCLLNDLLASSNNNNPEQQVDLRHLTSLLEDSLESHLSNVGDPLLWACGRACCGEVRHAHTQCDQLRFERAKLRADLSEANERALLLAQEIDDQNARLEKASQQRLKDLEQRYVDQIRELQSELSLEKETHLNLTQELAEQKKLLDSQYVDKEAKITAEIETHRQEIARLERENSNLYQRISALSSDLPTEEAPEMTQLKQNETDATEELAQRLLDLEDRLQVLVKANQDLQDLNDELTLQLEAAKALEHSRNRKRKPDVGTNRSLLSEDAASNSEDSEGAEAKVFKAGLLHQHHGHESLGAELGGQFFDPAPNVASSEPSSLESVDDSLVLVKPDERNHEASAASAQHLRHRLEHVEKIKDDLEAREKSLSSDLKAKGDELSRVRAQLEDTQQKLKQTEQQLGEEVERVSGEMETVQSRLLAAFHELDVCKERQKKDEDHIQGLNSKCAKMQEKYEKLRDNVVNLGSQANSNTSTSSSQTLSRSSSSASSAASHLLPVPLSNTLSLPPTSNNNNNIQVIAVRSDSSAGSGDASPSRHAPLRRVSKVMVNSTEPTDDRCQGQQQQQQKGLQTSASFSLGHLQQQQGLHQQPVSLPSGLGGMLKRSRSSTCAPGPAAATSASAIGAAQAKGKKVQVFQLEQHCRNLEGELDHVKEEILKMIEAKSSTSRENDSLKKYVKAYEQARAENDALKSEIALLKLMPKSPSLSSSSSSSSSCSPTQNLDRSSPDGQEFELDTTSSGASSSATSPECMRKDAKGNNGQAQEQIDELKRKFDAEEKEAQQKIQSLEESLELMRKEFDNMEDYWQGKLDDERSFYENQLRTSDNQFKDLEIKMKEYEELLMATEDNDRSHSSIAASNEDEHKLSTILETGSLEGQVADLEQEISDLKSDLEATRKEKQAELDRLQQEKLQLEARLTQVTHKLDEANCKVSKAETERACLESHLNAEVKRLKSQLKSSHSPRSVPLSRTASLYTSPKQLQQQQQPQSLPLDLIPSSRVRGPKQQPQPQHRPKAPDLAILQDIAKEKRNLEAEILALQEQKKKKKAGGAQDQIVVKTSTLDSGIALSPVKLMQGRLKQQEERCRSLQMALEQQQINSQLILQAARDQHRSEISHLESLMTANQELLRNQMIKYSDQIKRLAHSDELVKQLCAENETLVMAIQTLEDSIRDGVDGVDDAACVHAQEFRRASQECLEAVHNALLNTVYEEEDEGVTTSCSSSSSGESESSA